MIETNTKNYVLFPKFKNKFQRFCTKRHSAVFWKQTWKKSKLRDAVKFLSVYLSLILLKC